MAVADPDHENRQGMIDWRGPGFDPAAVNEVAIRKALAKFANRRRRKTKATPQSSGDATLHPRIVGHRRHPVALIKIEKSKPPHPRSHRTSSGGR